MKKITVLAAACLMITSVQAAPSVEDTTYAALQNCMAAAETPDNLTSQLDRYCIDSYLATRPMGEN